MKKLNIIFLALFISFNTFSQDDSVTLPKDLGWKFSIGIVPQYAAISGMRLDFDIKLNDRQYLTLAPQMYYNENYQLFYPDETDMKGVGLNLNYRYIFSKGMRPDGAYLGFGLIYKYYDLTYWGDEWVEYTELGSIYSTLEEMEINKKINQFGYDLLIGYEGTMDRFFYDLYIGWGFRLSDFDESESDDDFWSETIFDPGYSGFLPLIGFRAGIFLN